MEMISKDNSYAEAFIYSYENEISRLEEFLFVYLTLDSKNTITDILLEHYYEVLKCLYKKKRKVEK